MDVDGAFISITPNLSCETRSVKSESSRSRDRERLLEGRDDRDLSARRVDRNWHGHVDAKDIAIELWCEKTYTCTYTVHQLELTNGVDSQQVSIGGAQRIGTPTVDATVSRLHVGTEDGRICAFPVPFP